MKKYTLVLCLFLMSLPLPAYAGKIFERVKSRIKSSAGSKVNIGSKVKSGVKKGLGFIPGGGAMSNVLDEFTGGTDSEKIDGILEGMVDVSSDLMELKRLTENTYYAEVQARRRAANLAEGLRKGNMKKIFGAVVEETLNVPINPAEYIPNIPPTSQLKKNLDLEMDHERKLVRENGFYLTGSRRALLKSKPDLWKTDPKKFEEELKEAEKYDEELDEALRAQDMAMLKTLKSEQVRLQEENKQLAINLKKPGLKPNEVIQTKQAMSSNNKKIIDLNEEIRKTLKELKELNDKDKLKIAKFQAIRDRDKLNSFLRARRELIKHKYAHLSLLRF